MLTLPGYLSVVKVLLLFFLFVVIFFFNFFFFFGGGKDEEIGLLYYITSRSSSIRVDPLIFPMGFMLCFGCYCDTSTHLLCYMLYDNAIGVGWG